MGVYKPSVEAVTGAVIDRLVDTPFSDVMAAFGMNPDQFYKAVNGPTLDTCIDESRGVVKKALRQVRDDEETRRELFRMDDAFLKFQYDMVTRWPKKGGRYRFYYGTLTHPHNVDMLVYMAFSTNNPALSSHDRKEVVEGLYALPNDLTEYLKRMRLAGIMVHAIGNSPQRMLDSFDKVYQDRTGDLSIFDMDSEHHQPRWGFFGSNFKSTKSYWKDEDNQINSLYHILTEAYPKLGSQDRGTVVSTLESIYDRMQQRLFSLGLSGLMSSVFPKGEMGSPRAVIKRFDIGYQRRTGDRSLFDLNAVPHIHLWSLAGRAPYGYWSDKRNVEETVFHLLTEDNPNLASRDFKTAKRAFDSLQVRMTVYLKDLGLGVIMNRRYGKGYRSPTEILQIFDSVYRRTTGNRSLIN